MPHTRFTPLSTHKHLQSTTAPHSSPLQLTIQLLVCDPQLMEVADSTEQLMGPAYHKAESVIWFLVVEEIGF